MWIIVWFYCFVVYDLMPPSPITYNSKSFLLRWMPLFPNNYQYYSHPQILLECLLFKRKKKNQSPASFQYFEYKMPPNQYDAVNGTNKKDTEFWFVCVPVNLLINIQQHHRFTPVIYLLYTLFFFPQYRMNVANSLTMQILRYTGCLSWMDANECCFSQMMLHWFLKHGKQRSWSNLTKK